MDAESIDPAGSADAGPAIVVPDFWQAGGSVGGLALAGGMLVTGVVLLRLTLPALPNPGPVPGRETVYGLAVAGMIFVVLGLGAGIGASAALRRWLWFVTQPRTRVMALSVHWWSRQEYEALSLFIRYEYRAPLADGSERGFAAVEDVEIGPYDRAKSGARLEIEYATANPRYVRRRRWVT